MYKEASRYPKRSVPHFEVDISQFTLQIVLLYQLVDSALFTLSQELSLLKFPLFDGSRFTIGALEAKICWAGSALVSWWRGAIVVFSFLLNLHIGTWLGRTLTCEVQSCLPLCLIGNWAFVFLRRGRFFRDFFIAIFADVDLAVLRDVIAVFTFYDFVKLGARSFAIAVLLFSWFYHFNLYIIIE